MQVSNYRMMMKCYVVFGLFLSIIMTVQSQLIVTWQGVPVTGPLLIFHSEIQQTVNSNSLTCSHPTGPVAWYLANGNRLIESGGTFNNRITNGGRQAQIMRGTPNQDERYVDGLWTCRLNCTTVAEAFHVGVYDDTPSTTNGFITTVQGRSSRYTTNPTSFQLFGDSTGGPPTTSYWTRNGINITNNSTFSTSISFMGSHDEAGHRAANYQSILTVTGKQPGMYKYHVSNRRTNSARIPQILVDGNPPTGLTLRRVGLERVRVTWTDPDIIPRGGYRIKVTGDTKLIINGASSPEEISLSSPGSYVISLASLPRHYPILKIIKNITLIDLHLLAPTSPSMSSPTATSVTVSWTQPVSVGDLTVDMFRVTLTTTSTGMCLGFNHTQEEATTSTSMVIDGLEENSIYTVTISAMNNDFNAINTTSGLTITTLEAAPSGSPVIVMSPTVSSRSITVYWNEIPCIQRNGMIIRYDTAFGPSGEGTISGRSFTANGLTPFTNYTFRVRGVNSAGSGPYSDLTIITTSEEVNTVTVNKVGNYSIHPSASGPVSNLIVNVTLTSVNLLWSPPEQHNGILTRYEVTYRLNGSNEVITSNSQFLSTTFTIQSLTPNTGVSDISVSAYTSAGRGPSVMGANVVTLTTPPEVMEVQVQILTDTLVLVSWERILNIPEITHYTVFYSRTGSRKRQATGEQYRNVPSTEDSLVIRNLSGGARSYQFVVIAVATVDNVEIPGERPANPITPTSDGDVCSGDAIAVTFILTFILTILLYTAVLLVVCYIIYYVCYTNRTKSTNKQTEKRNTEDTHEVITTNVDSRDIDIKECVAYKQIPSTQATTEAEYEAVSFPQTEENL